MTSKESFGMHYEAKPAAMTPDELRWLRARLQASVTSRGAELGDQEAEEQFASDLDRLLNELLARRSSSVGSAPALPTQAQEQTTKYRDARLRVVITGVGVISSLGQSASQYWESLVNGRSGVSLIEGFDLTQMRTKIASQVKNWDPSPWIESRESKRMSRASQFVVSAARQALDDSRFPLPEGGTEQLGVLIGSGTTAFQETEAEIKTMGSRGASRVSPFFVPTALPGMPAGQLGLQFGARGWNAAITSTCAASTTAIGEGAEIIRRGEVTAMLVGGTEAPIAEFSMAAFNSLRAMSTRNDDPEGACRPWDRTRDGMVAGEGAAIMVLERLDHALARNAPIYAEVLGSGGSCDAHSLVAPDPTGRGGTLAVRRALHNSGVDPSDVDYINAHGPGTMNDPIETHIVKQVFGDSAYNVVISSTKSMAGHPLTACGAFEGLATVFALKYGVIPPTINLRDRDPVCDLDYTPLEARKVDIRIAMSQNFGLGGQNAAVVFRRWDGE
jgi:3-oxoacyl-[acyl-carrier-protein] synthase II